MPLVLICINITLSIATDDAQTHLEPEHEMYHLAQHKTLSSRTTSAFIAVSLVALTPTQALANPLDDAVEYVATLPSSSAFGLGCAVGAVAGGLVIGLVGVRARHRMRKEVDELVGLLERAESAARHAESMASVYMNTYTSQAARVTPHTKPDASKPTADEHESVASVDSILDPEFGTSKHEAPKTTTHEPAVIESVPVVSGSDRKPAHAAANKSALEASGDQVQVDLGLTTPMDEADKPDAPPTNSNDLEATNASSEQKHRKKLHEVLREQLDSTAAFNMPVINRGKAVQGAEPFYASSSRIRQVNPAVRARIIEKRIPRFDESLFPDIESELHTSADIFETAMRAMEDSLSAVPISAVEVETQPKVEFIPPNGHPEISDPEAYIEYLIQDEMERNRSGSARRYSRAHLTMIEGTADLSDVRTMRPRRARHMRVTSKEA